MKRKIICMMLAGLILLTSATSCSNKKEGYLKKIVLQEDVQADLLKDRQLRVSAEEVELKLEAGEYFMPAFYMGGEVYGFVDHGLGILPAVPEPTEQFPLDGRLKQYLYRLQNDNTVKETSKKVFTYEYHRPGNTTKKVSIDLYDQYKKDVRVYAVDYSKEDEPVAMEALDKALKAIRVTGKDIYFTEILMGEEMKYLVIEKAATSKGRTFYIYDVQQEKLYTPKEEGIEHGPFQYLKALDSFVCIDNNLKCYRVVFEKDKYRLVEYMDLKQYIKPVTDPSSKKQINFMAVNDEEILILSYAPFMQGGYFDYHPVREIKFIYSFNFETNQFQELFTSKEQQHVNAMYIGNLGSGGGALLVMDEFSVEKDSLAPKKRYFGVMDKGQINTIYEENTEEEGNTLSPYSFCQISEDGRELFLAKRISIMENGVETDKRVVYKKYRIEW